MEGNIEFNKSEGVATNSKEPGFIRRLKGRFVQVFKDQSKESPPLQEEPKISIDIFYSPHGSSEDREGLVDRFKNADIYIPEASGWSENTLLTYRDVSMGNIDPKKALDKLKIRNGHPFYPVLLSELSMLYGSKKAIGFIDEPENHPLFKKNKKLLSNNVNLFESSFEDLFTACKSQSKSFGELEKARDDYMVSRLKPTVLEIINSNPELKDNDKVSVLLFLGSLNTPVFHQLKREGNFDVSRTISGKQFGFQDEMNRRAMFDREISETLIAQSVAEILFAPALSNYDVFKLIGNDYNKLRVFNRKLFSTFSYDEIKNLVDEFTNKREKIKGFFQGSPPSIIARETVSALNSVFYKRFLERGIDLGGIKSMQEVDEFLAKTLPPRLNPPEPKP